MRWLSVAGNRLSYPQSWPEDRRHVTTVGETLPQVCAARTPEAMSHWPSSRDVCPHATPVDNLNDACQAATYSQRVQ